MSDVDPLDERRRRSRLLPRADQIEIRGLQVHAHHGVFPHERSRGQPFLLDITINVDTRIAARTDHISDAVDYGEVVEEVAELVRSTQFRLLETLGARIADRLLLRRGVVAVAIRVAKPEVELPETVGSVAVTVHRARPTHVT